VFYGERLLTSDNPEAEQDRRLFQRLGIAFETVVERDQMQPRGCHKQAI
jgi:biotin synthase